MNTTMPDTTGGKTTPYESDQPVGKDGFPQLLRSEWTKFRTIRGWVIAMIAAAVLVGLPIVALGNAGKDNNSIPNPPIGPNGLAVTDSFYFQHRPIGADASITARVTALTGTQCCRQIRGALYRPELDSLSLGPRRESSSKRAARPARPTRRSWSRPITACASSTTSPTTSPA